MKLTNEYAKMVHFERMPKAVLAAVAVSFAVRLSDGDIDDLSAAAPIIAEEWRVLHANGIVPQKPPGRGGL